nr:unnamed protein product [Callosobruchus analis]
MYGSQPQPSLFKCTRNIVVPPHSNVNDAVALPDSTLSSLVPLYNHILVMGDLNVNFFVDNKMVIMLVFSIVVMNCAQKGFSSMIMPF